MIFVEGISKEELEERLEDCFSAALPFPSAHLYFWYARLPLPACPKNHRASRPLSLSSDTCHPCIFCEALSGYAFFPLDNFKLINEANGHLVGDAVLCMVADELKSSFQDSLLGRVGGDETDHFETALPVRHIVKKLQHEQNKLLHIVDHQCCIVFVDRKRDRNWDSEKDGLYRLAGILLNHLQKMYERAKSPTKWSDVTLVNQVPSFMPRRYVAKALRILSPSV